MDEATRAKWHREAKLDGMTSVQLGKMLVEKGYKMDAKQNKANRRLAILHLEGHKVTTQIVESLKLKPLEQVNGSY